MWTDTHLHLDTHEYDHDRVEVVSRALNKHVNRFVLPAVHANHFNALVALAHRTPGAVYCLGIHPLLVHQSEDYHLEVLRDALQQHRGDPLLAGVGEIGLDGFVPGLDWNRQVAFFHAQLKMARDFDLPVVMHVRKAQDPILKGLRMFKPKSGIAHAFNGSFQQAEHFLNLHMKLGFGGACTFTRALQLRRLAAELPLEALVLETDGPDIPPEWINKQRNEPAHLPQIAEVIATLRNIPLQTLAQQVALNSESALPALRAAKNSFQ
ncbi:MAG TPA: TatD family hydrolase [Limnobacter sp.]|uniref:TatD family hydrolase n=1 Tax=Limnobacter sp. TaxID=2003368 RepID=UPI002ED999BB